MNSLTKEDLYAKVISYNEREIENIKKAYNLAEKLHSGQKRQSGEDYIIHPLNVAYILASMYADEDTICAGLLHDTLEDTEITKETLANQFNSDVAELVDGVSKIRRMNFASKEDKDNANTRKLFISMAKDIRVIIIKVADRLHNMRTLEYKSKFKQRENALETIQVYAPLAYRIGSYRIKSELEDLSLQYLEKEKYEEIRKIREEIEYESRHCVEEMLYKINSILDDHNINHEIKVRVKNIYGIYKRLEKGDNIPNIHDLLSLKIMVDDCLDCYKVLGLIHYSLGYHPIDSKFKDFISNPKTNKYASLHTTVFGVDNRLVQIQIRTFNMDKVASFGLTSYWQLNKGNDARRKMQEEFAKEYTLKTIVRLNEAFPDNKEFIDKIMEELLTESVYVLTPKGDRIELPKGSTVVDFAYQIHSSVGNRMVSAIVNDEKVPFNYTLSNKDRVEIITNENSKGPNEEWFNYAKTTKAKRKIKEYRKKISG